ncbi:CRISPR-associated endonuclease Cas2 [Sulfurimonas sp.]
MSQTPIGKYMYLVCFFDLPVHTKKDRRRYTIFRRKLMQAGFVMMQYSVYITQIRGTHQVQDRIKKVKSFAPKNGEIRLLTVTDRQFDRMEMIINYEYMKSDESLSYGCQTIMEF